MNSIHDVHKIGKTVSDYCSSQPAIIASYLFGSLVRNTARQPKDIDIAFLLYDQKAESFRLCTCISELEGLLGIPVDGVILNRAGEKLKFEVRCHGRLVFDRYPPLRKNFEIKGRKLYEDFLYLHKHYVDRVLYEK